MYLFLYPLIHITNPYNVFCRSSKRNMFLKNWKYWRLKSTKVIIFITHTIYCIISYQQSSLDKSGVNSGFPNLALKTAWWNPEQCLTSYRDLGLGKLFTFCLHWLVLHVLRIHKEVDMNNLNLMVKYICLSIAVLKGLTTHPHRSCPGSLTLK